MLFLMLLLMLFFEVREWVFDIVLLIVIADVWPYQIVPLIDSELFIASLGFIE